LVLTFGKKTWRSRPAKSCLHIWSRKGKPLRLVEQLAAADDPDPKALACCGLLARWQSDEGEGEEAICLRFLKGHPVSEPAVAFLQCSCAKVEALGKGVLALIIVAKEPT
jgi:hypothetical protein